MYKIFNSNEELIGEHEKYLGSKLVMRPIKKAIHAVLAEDGEAHVTIGFGDTKETFLITKGDA